MAETQPEGIPVTVGTVRISTPGLAGRVEVYQSGTSGMRGAESSTAAFREALDDAGMVEQLTVEITGQRELDTPAAAGAAGAAARSSSRYRRRAPATASCSCTRRRTARSRGTFPTTCRRTRWSAAAATGGPTGCRVRWCSPTRHRPAAARHHRSDRSQAVQDPRLPLLDPVLGKVGDHFAGRWDRRIRRNLVRWFDPGDYRRADVAAFASPDWTRCPAGPRCCSSTAPPPSPTPPSTSFPPRP